MLESADELSALQALLDRSHAGSTEHLRDIISEDRRLTAANIVALLTGMKVIRDLVVQHQRRCRQGTSHAG